MPVTWMDKPLSISVEFSVWELLKMLKKLPADELPDVAIQLMMDFDKEQFSKIQKWLEDGA